MEIRINNISIKGNNIGEYCYAATITQYDNNDNKVGEIEIYPEELYCLGQSLCTMAKVVRAKAPSSCKEEFGI